MRRLLVTVAGCAALLLAACTEAAPTAGPAAGCTPEWSFPTVQQGRLTIATVSSMPYVDIKAGSTSVDGIDSVLLNDFARRACLTPQWQPLAGPAAIAAMTEGRADVAAGGWYATPERGATIGQTRPVWFDFNAIVSTAGYATIEELRGRVVGVYAGSVYDAALTTALGDAAVRRYQSIDAVFQDLGAGRIDAAVGSSSECAYQVKQRGADMKVKVLAPDAAYSDLTSAGKPNYPHTKGNAALGTALDSYITSARTDGTVRNVLADYGLTDQRNFDGA